MLNDFVSKHISNINGTILNIAFNIDGIPLYKSFNSQLWPILAQVKNVESEPFPIGVFYGMSKSKPLLVYFKEFVDELQAIVDKGVLFKDVLFQIKIFGVICDAPALAFIKCIKHHGGY